MRRSRRRGSAALRAAGRGLAAAAALSGCATGPGRHPTLDATLWMQTSAEYRALARQTFRAASSALVAGLADTAWSALLEQGPGAGALPPAAIVDVDETVLDNSPYAARLIREDGEYDRESWFAWVREAAAPAVPGAVAFAREARRLGIRLFYVTNRDHEVEAATRRNLRARGFPLEDGDDVVLTRGEREAWGSDKTSRRAWVARRHRVLAVVGDDLNDFLSGAIDTRARRAELVVANADRWGRTWFVLPNPTYGSWEAALYGHEGALPLPEKLESKYRSLDPAL